MNGCPEDRPATLPAERVRAFVALPLPTQVLNHVAQVQRRLRREPAAKPVRWTRSEQIHLTLKFLGNVSREDLDRVRDALNAACAGLSAFELALAQLGCFPHARNPRVVWIGLTGALERLADLQQRIDGSLHGFGDHLEEGRAFHPHLTLGRVNARGEGGRDLAELLARERVPPVGTWTVRQVDLIQSELRPQGAHYTVRHSVRLSD